MKQNSFIQISMLAILVVATLGLSGCSWWQKIVKPVEVETRVESVKIFHPALPSEISLQNIKWKVLTPEILEKYVEDYKKGEVDPLVVYSLSVPDYQLLAENIAKIKKLLKDQQEIIIYYRSLK